MATAYGEILATAPSQTKLLSVELLAAERRRCKARQAAVLAIPDAAACLKDPPIDYVEAENWNGYIPPKWVEKPGAHWGELMANPSPRRAALVALLETIGYSDEGVC